MAILSGPVNYLADVLSVPEDAVRLICGLVFSQLFAIVHRVAISKISSNSSKLGIHLLLGLFLGYFVWNVDFLHHCASAIGFYILFLVLPWGLATKVNFLYQLGYLVVGYYYNNMVTNYSINWTTSQAIITLKMIGIGFDLNDQRKRDPKAEQVLPGLFEVFGYVFFMGTYLVGPLDDFERFRAFINGDLFKGEECPSIAIGLKRVAHGIFYLLISLVSTSFFNTDYLFSEQFLALPVVLRVLYVTVWGHCGLYKYLGVWCIAESTCMYMGYTYKSNGDWNGLRNVATSAFHQSVRLQHVIDSWNINTSSWCAKHIYKRCRFLGNKILSQLITMLFLATWHGLHLGYFLCFFQEFFYMFMEKGMDTNSLIRKVTNHLPAIVKKGIAFIYTKVFLSFALVGFELYHYDRILYIYQAIYFICPVSAIFIISSNIMFYEKQKPEKKD